MPKLSAKAAEAAEREADPFGPDEKPIPEGEYRLKLVGVDWRELHESKEPKLVGSDMLIWTFEVIEGEHARRRFSLNTIVPPDDYRHAPRLFRKLLDTFEAVGGSLRDDTDDLVGRICKGFVELVPDWRREAKPGDQVNRLEEVRADGDESGDPNEF